jgi:hypothetical protein
MSSARSSRDPAGTESLGQSPVGSPLSNNNRIRKPYVSSSRELEHQPRQRAPAPADRRASVMGAESGIEIRAHDLAQAGKAALDGVGAQLAPGDLGPPGMHQELPTPGQVARQIITLLGTGLGA